MRYDIKTMSHQKKVVSLGQLPQEELDKLTEADKTVLATALIYSLSELIAPVSYTHLTLPTKRIV